MPVRGGTCSAEDNISDYITNTIVGLKPSKRNESCLVVMRSFDTDCPRR